MKHLTLIDGSGFIFRAYYARMQQRLTRSDGTPTNAVFIFTQLLMKLVEDTDADHIAVVFDTARKTFRNDIYPDYKANRPPPPDDLIPQFPLVREATKAMNVAQVEMEGFEADDLIATYARQGREAGVRVTIVSSDKDLMQLVGPGVSMRDPMSNRLIGPAEVEEKFGVGPDRVIDVQALAGDSTDNVPGVPGIGEQSAGRLISFFCGLQKLLSKGADLKSLESEVTTAVTNLETEIFELAGCPFKISSSKELGEVLFETLKLPGGKKDEKSSRYDVTENTLRTLCEKGHRIACEVIKWRFTRKIPNLVQKILEKRDIVDISRDLVTLRDDVPVVMMFTDFAVKPPDPDAFLAFLREQEFNSLISRIESQAAASGVPRPGADKAPQGGAAAYELVQTAAALQAWIDEARAAGMVAVDTETTSLDSMQARLVGLSLATRAGRACYVPLAHGRDAGALELAPGPPQIPTPEALALLAPLLGDPAVLKVGQNIKYDMQVLGRLGVAISPVDDTMVLSYVLDGGLHGHGMDALAEIHLGRDTIKYTDVVGSGKKQLTFDQVPLDQALDYAAEDADVTLCLHRVLKPRLVTERMATVYETMERPLIPVLEGMERAGIAVDASHLKRLSADFTVRLDVLKTEIHALAGREFNVGSPKQLGEVLFEDLGLAGGKKGKTGAYATGADVLEGLAAEGHDVAQRMLDWRQLAKLKSTYADALVDQVNPETGRVHTSYAMASTSTGRLSSSDPNLQNIPVRTEEGRKIRSAFIAEDGHMLLSADYSQIELRLLAHVAGIEALKEAFRDGIDIHALTASQVFGVPTDGMDPQIRRQAKAINFGIIYGISAFGLARQLGIPRTEAGDYIEAYFERYPGIRDYMERTKEEARERGFVSTLFGRRCHIGGLKDKNPARRNFAERAAINAPIQGGAADIIKRAMIRLPGALEGAGLSARMLLQVHDELIFEVPSAEVDDTAALVARVMEGAARLDVPLVVDTGAGDTWEQAH